MIEKIAKRRTAPAIADADLTDDTATLTCPTICIAGADDQATPPELVAALASSIPGTILHVLPDVGHLPCIEAPETVATHVAALLKELT